MWLSEPISTQRTVSFGAFPNGRHTMSTR